jgi:hypothetical protein
MSDSAIIRLRGWFACEGVVEIRDDSDSFRRRVPFGEEIPRCTGFFHGAEQGWSAVFELNGRLHFQLDEQRWDWLDDRVQIASKRLICTAFERVVVVRTNKQCRLRTRYRTAFADLIGRDMSIDGIDEDSDWWYWLARVVNNRANHQELLGRWRKGI